MSNLGPVAAGRLLATVPDKRMLASGSNLHLHSALCSGIRYEKKQRTSLAETLNTLLSTFFGFVLTSIIGAWLTREWQRRALRESRLFDASRETYAAMAQTADEFVSLIGSRIYSSQRVCLLPLGSPVLEEAVASYRNDVIEWNKALIRLELRIRRLFRTVRQSRLEELQSELRQANINVEKIIRDPTLDRDFRIKAHAKLNVLRGRFVEYADDMNAEIRMLFREMHFGIKQRADTYDIYSMSTWNLAKSLFYPGKNPQAVVSSASNFGDPVTTDNARFRIYEE